MSLGHLRGRVSGHGQCDRQHSGVPASGAKIEAVIFLSHWERKKETNEFLSCQKGVSYGHAHILQDKNNFIQFLTSFEMSEQTDSEDLQVHQDAL